MSYVDTTLAIFSDMHSGSSTALFPNRFWQSTAINARNHTPTDRQKKIYKHFRHCIETGRNARHGRRLIVVHNGDAIDGVHHGTKELITYVLDEQKDLHIELMDEVLQGMKFNRAKGDRLYYLQGTESHVGDEEHQIAKDLRAERTPEGGRIFQHLELNINGISIWFVHHGPRRGEGQNEGDSLRNWLKRQYWKLKNANKAIPNIIITGHTHLECYNTYILRDVTVHGFVLPAWQEKTRYGYMIAPVDQNDIGAVFLTILKDGTILPPKREILRTDSEHIIRL